MEHRKIETQTERDFMQSVRRDLMREDLEADTDLLVSDHLRLKDEIGDVAREVRSFRMINGFGHLGAILARRRANQDVIIRRNPPFDPEHYWRHEPQWEMFPGIMESSLPKSEMIEMISWFRDGILSRSSDVEMLTHFMSVQIGTLCYESKASEVVVTYNKRLIEILVDLGLPLDPNEYWNGAINTVFGNPMVSPHRQKDFILFFIGLGADINAQTRTPIYSALHGAIYSIKEQCKYPKRFPHDTDMIRFLLDVGADPFVKAPDGKTPREKALSLGCPDVANIFLEAEEAYNGSI